MSTLLSYELENRKLKIDYFVRLSQTVARVLPHQSSKDGIYISNRFPCIEVLRLGCNGLSHNATKPLHESARVRKK